MQSDHDLAQSSHKDASLIEGSGDMEGQGEAELDLPVQEGPSIPEDNYVIGYGPKTITALQEAINSSFKLFWDGSISLFYDTFLSSCNNKDILKTLLEMRRKTNDDEEPPVTLLHGQETEKVLRKTLMFIKDEEQKMLEAKQRAAQQKLEEVDEEEEEENEDDMDLGDESEEKLTTFQQDLEMMTDLSCFTSSEFTTKVM